MSQNISLLKKSTLIGFLSDDDVLNNIRSGKFRIVSYKKKSVVHFDGEICYKLEIILSGKIVVDSIDESGNLLTISEFYSNDVIGGNLLFSKNPHFPMTVTTQLPTDILEIDREVLYELLCNYPKLLRAFLEIISDQAFFLGDKIKHYVNKSIRDSILNYLNYESNLQKSNKVKLNMTKKALSERIGVQRTSLSRELAKMRDDGLIDFDKESITLLKY